MEIVVPPEFQRLWVCDAEHPILKVPHPSLRETARAVKKVTGRHRQLAENMSRLMRKADGVGLAATQLGILERIVVVAPETRTMVLINPEILSAEGSVVMEEGCLSLPGLYGMVERPEQVVVRALDRRGCEVTYELAGMPARVVQHEVDHLDGVLFIDKADPATLHWMWPASRTAE
jgi:peptide deformylase